MTITEEQRKNFALNMDRMSVMLEDIERNGATPEKLQDLNKLFEDLQEPLMLFWESIKNVFLNMMDAMVIWFDSLPDEVKQMIQEYVEEQEAKEGKNDEP